MRVHSIVGARPQFIKAAIVSAALQAQGIDEVLIHTGQHFDARMSDVFFSELGLPTPGHHLGIASLGHGAMTGRMLEAIERVLTDDPPDCVLVYGDTNSTLAGALAAAKLNIPVAHVESGMRSFNRRMPEEVNRVLTDHVASLHLVTSEAPRALLAREGITSGVHVVGDVMYDAALRFRDAAARTGAHAALGLGGAPFGLVTLHRAENTDDPTRLAAIAHGLARLGEDLALVLPLHPRTRGALDRAGVTLSPAVRVLSPLGYLEMLDLEAHASLILTDSGGVQKEALFAGCPCVTLRDETEWTETVESGWNTLVGASAERMVTAARASLAAPPRGTPPTIYGDGSAGPRIARLLSEVLGARPPHGA
jgi:UDP-GlcNAc3NAcA epimerase